MLATNLEDKMGIAVDDHRAHVRAKQPCVGYLVGGVHEGIKQMFLVIEDARFLIGTKSLSTLSTA